MTKKYKSFIDLSQAECQQAYSFIIENSNQHFEIAELLSSNKYYGSAISHLILSSEELLKAMIIYFDANGTEIRKIKGIETFFIHHSPRLIYLGLHLLFPKDTIKEGINYLVNKGFMDSKLIPRSELDYLYLRFAENKDFGIEESQYEDFKVRMEELNHSHILKVGSSFAFFLVRAEMFKQQGFYVDFKDRIQTPKVEFNIEKYEYTKKETSSIKEIIESYITELEAMEESAKKEFVTKLASGGGLYESFRGVIRTSNSIRKKKS